MDALETKEEYFTVDRSLEPSHTILHWILKTVWVRLSCIFGRHLSFSPTRMHDGLINHQSVAKTFPMVDWVTFRHHQAASEPSWTY